jgi:hypothetical protein
MNYRDYYNQGSRPGSSNNQPPNDFERMTKNRKINLGYGGQASTLGDGSALGGYNSGPMNVPPMYGQQGPMPGGMGGGQMYGGGFTGTAGSMPMAERQDRDQQLMYSAPFGGGGYGAPFNSGPMNRRNTPWWKRGPVYQQPHQQVQLY